jgi:hypothetical protein
VYRQNGWISSVEKALKCLPDEVVEKLKIRTSVVVELVSLLE